MATAIQKQDVRESDPFERVEDLLPAFAARCAAHDAKR